MLPPNWHASAEFPLVNEQSIPTLAGTPSCPQIAAGLCASTFITDSHGSERARCAPPLSSGMAVHGPAKMPLAPIFTVANPSGFMLPVGVKRARIAVALPVYAH